jgi:nitric oxide reductase NorD protein
MPRRGAPPAGAEIRTADYDEWDTFAGRYRPRAATVHQWQAVAGDASHGAWARDALREHGALVHRIRERFGRLRAQRLRLMRQRDGEMLDLEACIRAAVDLRLGHTVDDRLYASVRPARRGLAIALLVDASGSTDAPVAGTRQVIDVEKTAALLAGEALDALGDPYAVLAFSSRGARHVWMRVVKEFAERNGEPVRQRLAALEPEANTRLGAAVRHATALLAREPAGHRLLLIVSDGRPNDVDHYQERFAVEDARQSVMEARAAGVHPFCLTVDREQPDYLPRIFGPAGYTIMRHPDQLPGALLGAVKTLLGA